MGERKVINTYISPDFDPKIMPKMKRSKEPFRCEIRNMIPFSMQCKTCGTYMYAGKKFTMKMEPARDKKYLGITVFRFYMKCSQCSSMITYLTDPKNTDYELESGATRNYEMWKEKQRDNEEIEKEREEEDRLDAMKALENRTLDSKNEIDILDALDEIKAVNHRHEKVNMNTLLGYIWNKYNKNEDDSVEVPDNAEDSLLIEEFMSSQARRKLENNNSSSSNSNSIEGEVVDEVATSSIASSESYRSLGDSLDFTFSSSGQRKVASSSSSLSIPIGTISMKKRRVEQTNPAVSNTVPPLLTLSSSLSNDNSNSSSSSSSSNNSSNNYNSNNSNNSSSSSSSSSSSENIIVPVSSASASKSGALANLLGAYSDSD